MNVKATAEGKGKAEPRGNGEDPFLRLYRERCLSCAACVAVCEPRALLLRGLELVYLPERCEPCADCLRVCPVMALAPARGSFYRETS